MSQTARLDKLWPLLTAKERGILVLKSAKTGEAEDYRIYTTVPNHQIPEFNRYIRLMSRVNVELNMAVGILRLMVEKTGLRLGWLATVRFWSLQATRLWACLEDTREPMTASGYTELKLQEERKLVPLAEAAEEAAEIRWDGAEEVESDAWEREVRSWAGQLEEAVGSGAVEAVTGPEGLQVRQGSFHVWLGEELPVIPEIGGYFEVRPDSEAECVGLQRRLRSSALDALRNSPSAAWTFGYGSKGAEELRRGSLGKGDQLAGALTETISWQLKAQWAELRAMELVLGEIAVEFDGEDPTLPRLRGEITELKESLVRLRDEAVDCFGGVELLEPTNDELEMMRKFVLGDQSR